MSTTSLYAGPPLSKTPGSDALKKEEAKKDIPKRTKSDFPKSRKGKTKAKLKRVKRIKRTRQVRKKVTKPNPKLMAALKKRWPNTLLVRVQRRQKKQGNKKPGPGKKSWVDAAHFLMDRTEVTVAAYRACVTAGKCSLPLPKGKYCNYAKAGKANHPINCINWHQARQFCRWQGKRLPFAREWKWAAQGPRKKTYPWGDQTPSCKYAVYRGNKKQAGCDKDGTWPVSSRLAGNSPFGMTDMSGNVSEWVADCAQTNPRGTCTRRKILGGSWQSMALSLAVEAESYAKPSMQGPLTGFRCAADAPSNLMITEDEVVDIEEIIEVPIPEPRPVRRQGPRVQTYILSIPEILIAPCDQQCKNWDSVGGIPQLKLLTYRREFRKLTKGLTNHYCWKEGNQWSCSQKRKSLFLRILRIADKLMETYQHIHGFTQKRGYFRPDPELVVWARGQKLTFKKRSDTFSPSWNQGKRIRLKYGDKITISLYDRDPLFRKSLITRFSFRFLPPLLAQRAKQSRYVHNNSALAKNLTLQFLRR